MFKVGLKQFVNSEMLGLKPKAVFEHCWLHDVWSLPNSMPSNTLPQRWLVEHWHAAFGDHLSAAWALVLLMLVAAPSPSQDELPNLPVAHASRHPEVNGQSPAHADVERSIR